MKQRPDAAVPAVPAGAPYRYLPVLALAAALVLALRAAPARAACGVTATGLSFPAYDPFSNLPTDGSATVSILCDTIPPTDVTASFSTGGSGSYGRRTMQRVGGNELLGYNLFLDSGMGTVAGDGAAGGGTLFIKNVGKARPKTVTFYGRIPARQNVPAGSYTDSVTVTITW